VVDDAARSGVGIDDQLGEPRNGLFIKVLGAWSSTHPSTDSAMAPRAVLCFLAFHRDRAISAGELQTALWPLSKTQRDVSPRTLQNYVSEARRAVGADVLPETKRGAGYRLESVSTDFDEFTRLVRESMAAEPDVSRTLRRQALALVREHPFASEYSDFFEWSRRDGIERQMVLSISRGGAAHRHRTAR
jgi:DNA-binding SARP family transcriptional activator